MLKPHRKRKARNALRKEADYYYRYQKIHCTQGIAKLTPKYRGTRCVIMKW